MYKQLLIDMLVVVCGLGLYLFLTFYLKKAAKKNGKTLQIVDHISLGTKEKVMLLNVNRQLLLIGVTPTQINLLTEIPNEQERNFKSALNEKQFTQPIKV